MLETKYLEMEQAESLLIEATELQKIIAAIRISTKKINHNF